MKTLKAQLFLAVSLLFAGCPMLSAEDAGASGLDPLVGQPADIAPSAYQYRADRKPEDNPPESWFGLVQYAELPYNKPVNVNAPAIKKVLCGLLWEEVRPVRRVELSWPGDAKNRPSADDLTVSYFDATDDNAHTWWNPRTLKEAGKPEVATDGRTFVYTIPVDTWCVVVNVRGKKEASAFAVPAIRAFVQDVWNKADVEIEWGFEDATAGVEYDGRVEVYDGIIGNLRPLAGDAGTVMTGPGSWRSARKGDARRGVQMSLLYIGTSRWKRKFADPTPPEEVARSIVTLWTKSGNFSFRVSDLEQGPIFAPEYGFFVRATGKPQTVVKSEAPFSMQSSAATAKDFLKELQGKGLKTIRQRVREHAEQSWQGAVAAMYPGKKLPPHPRPAFDPAVLAASMQVEVPDGRMTAQWKLGDWHILRTTAKDQNGKWWFCDYPFGVLAAETYQILRALDFRGMHNEAANGLDQWLKLPLEPLPQGYSAGNAGLWKLFRVDPGTALGYFSDGKGCFTHAVGPEGGGANMDGIHTLGPGIIMHAMNEHFRLTGDMEWLKTNAPRMKANAEWILRQRKVFAENIPGGQRLWCKGLQPAMMGTTDAGLMFAQFYLMEAHYWLAVKQTAGLLTLVDAQEGAKMAAEADAYRTDILAALDRSIALTPVMPVRDGTYRSFIPASLYARGMFAGAWGWRRCHGHTGALYWDSGLATTPLINPSGLLSIHDRRVQGFLDVLEDRILLENPKNYTRTSGYDPDKQWFSHAGWQYQCGFERTPNLHLEADDIPNFLRSMLNQYAADIQLDGYTFREHTIGGPLDKSFEEASFLERFRQMLVMEEGDTLWVARATPRAWLEQGKKISVKNAPTHFGMLDYEIVSNAANGKITATVEMPSRRPPRWAAVKFEGSVEKEGVEPPKAVLLRLRHPKALPMKSVAVNGSSWADFDPVKEVIRLHDVRGTIKLEATY